MMPSTLDKGYSPECPEVVFSEVHIQHSPGPIRYVSPDRVERIFLIIPVGASLFAAAILAGYDRGYGHKKEPRHGRKCGPQMWCMPDQPITGRGIKEIVAAQSWYHHTPPAGPPLCPTILSAMRNIHPLLIGVGCGRYVASMTPREGAGQLPALLLDQG